MWINLILNSALLGFGLAMDAFSVSLTNGLSEPKMKLKKTFFIAGIFALFQALMPLIGWVAVAGFVEIFKNLNAYIPWVAFIVLCFIGGKMIFDTVRDSKKEDEPVKSVTTGAIFVQAIATSIDALTAGTELASDYFLSQYVFVLISVAIIALLTFAICFGGVKIGQSFGTKLSDKAGYLGGGVLIFLGLKIFVLDILLAA